MTLINVVYPSPQTTVVPRMVDNKSPTPKWGQLTTPPAEVTGFHVHNGNDSDNQRSATTLAAAVVADQRLQKSQTSQKTEYALLACASSELFLETRENGSGNQHFRDAVRVRSRLDT